MQLVLFRNAKCETAAVCTPQSYVRWLMDFFRNSPTTVLYKSQWRHSLLTELDPLVGWGFPSPTTPKHLGSAPRHSAKVPLFLESKKSLINYIMQHCSQPFGPYVQTDINVTGLMVKGPEYQYVQYVATAKYTQ